MTEDAPLERLTPEELGLPEGARFPFQFVPGATWSPLVVSFPHVGLAWPHELRPKPQADFARNADYQVHTLYQGLERLGVASIAAHFSRLVVDLNRASDDVARQLVPDHPTPRPRAKPGVAQGPAPQDWDRPGRGVVWASALTADRRTTRILQPPLSLEAFEARIARFHQPYYRALEILLRRRRERFGYAVLLDAHSMPSTVGIDLVLGTLDGASCGEPIAAAAIHALRGLASTAQPRRALLSVRRDDPYQGGEIVRTFGRPREGVHALQLEVSRRLYMDERVYRVWRWPPDLGPGTTDTAPRGVLDEALDVPSRRRGRELQELITRLRSLVVALSSRPSSTGGPEGEAEPPPQPPLLPSSR